MTPPHNHGQDNGNILTGCTCDDPWSGFALATVIPPPGTVMYHTEKIRHQSLPWYERYRSIYSAVLTLTARCDGAKDEDGIGWNKDDAYLMHDLADTPISQWTLTDFQDAWHRLYKYRNTQLPFIGVDYSKLPRPVTPGARVFSSTSLH